MGAFRFMTTEGQACTVFKPGTLSQIEANYHTCACRCDTCCRAEGESMPQSHTRAQAMKDLETTIRCFQRAHNWTYERAYKEALEAHPGLKEAYAGVHRYWGDWTGKPLPAPAAGPFRPERGEGRGQPTGPLPVTIRDLPNRLAVPLFPGGPVMEVEPYELTRAAAGLRLKDLVDEYQWEHPSATWGEAFQAVWKAHPNLAAQYAGRSA